MVFGRALVKSQTAFLHLIPAGSNVLIAGGGTGWILEEIGRIHPSGLHITYVEISEKMIALAMKRNTGANVVNYVNLPVEVASLTTDFDVAITPFLLDSLSGATLYKAFNSILVALKPSGLWLNTDFQLTGKWWQKLLLSSMYLFFKTIGCIENAQLPEIKRCFDEKGLQTLYEKTFFGEFIVATVYGK